MPSPTLKARGRLNALQRHRPADDPELIEARRDLKAAHLEQYVARVVSEAPPLTPAQLDRIAVLLRPAGDA